MPKRPRKRAAASYVRRSAASLKAEAAIETAVIDRLAQQMEQLSVEFIKTELELGLTFAGIVRSYKDPHRRKWAIDKATVAYRTALEKLSEVHPGQPDRERIEQQRKKLELALEQLTNG